ncbi:MAG: Ppx/GppA phosphatase family protein [Bacteroidetes bacterium]|nr:Ppx/GppA phosphatase family protein [Bacteroidota bacterium]
MKLAILDLGTNTFHLLIVEVNRDRTFKKIFKSKIVVKLGEGAIQEKYIADVPFARGLNALNHYAGIIEKHKADKIYAFATSGIRSAKNGKEFVRFVKEETGIKIDVITGNREAELICYGVRGCVSMGDEKHLIMDIGGGSTEFIIANDKKIFWKQSFDIGASRLLESFKPSNPIINAEVKRLEKFLIDVIKPLEKALKRFPVKTLIGSSGSFDTLAEMSGWKFHRRDVLKNITTLNFNLDEFQKLHSLLLKSTIQQRMKMKGLIKMRVDMIVIASICTNLILNRYKLEKMILSKYALKEGALWQIISTFSKTGHRKLQRIASHS